MLELSQIFREKKFYFELLKKLGITSINCTIEENVQYDILYDYCVDRDLYHRGIIDETSDELVLTPVYWEEKPISKLWDSEYYVLDIYAEYIPYSVIIKCTLVNKLRDFEEYIMCAFSKEEFEKNEFKVSINTEYPEEDIESYVE